MQAHAVTHTPSVYVCVRMYCLTMTHPYTIAAKSGLWNLLSSRAQSSRSTGSIECRLHGKASTQPVHSFWSPVWLSPTQAQL